MATERVRFASKKIQPRSFLHESDKNSSHESFANVFQLQTEGAPKRPSISHIKKHIQNIKRSRYAKMDDSSRMMEKQSLFTIKQDDREGKRSSEVTLAQQDQNDNMGPVFSPYKEKSPERMMMTIDGSINWQTPTIKLRRQSIQLKPQSLQSRRRTLKSAMQPRIQTTTPVENKRGFSAKSSASNFKVKKMAYMKEVLPPSPTPSINHQPYYIGLDELNKLYEIVSQLALALKDHEEQRMLLKARQYVQLISSGSLLFIDELIDESDPKIKKQLNFARLLQNVSIIYLMLQHIKGTLNQNEVNILNFIGHCASNIIFLVRLFTLNKKALQILPATKFQEAIDQFQIEQFKQRLYTVDQVALRLQHSNEIVTILEGKIGRRHGKFSLTLKKFIRNIERGKYSSSECSHYLFDYLAFFIYENELNGRVTFLDISPNPYLNTVYDQEKYTVVIEPYGILLVFQNGRTFYRQLARKFIDYLCKHFEVILWTWMMPADIDPWLDQIDTEGLCRRLYKYHCKHEDNIFKKNIMRLGRRLQKTIIIDYDHRIYAQTPDNGIEMGWNLQSKDQKLLDLTQILLQMKNNKLSIQQTLKIYNEQICKLRYRQAIISKNQLKT